MAECKRVFGDNILVYSNSCGAADYDPTFRLAEEFEKLNGISVLRHNSKKPNGIESILGWFKGSRPGEIVFIGDRVLTDVLMANEAGLFSVLVSRPLSIQGDNLPAVIVRFVEKKLLQLIDPRINK